MRRWVMVGVGLVVGLVVLGVVLSGVQRARLNADRQACLYRLQMIGQFAAVYAEASAKLKPGEVPPPNVPLAVPPGTVVNPALDPYERLSWIAHALPFLDQSLQNTLPVHQQIDFTLAWDAIPNRPPAAARLNLFVCPGAVPEVPPGEPFPTQFVGLSGVGPDSAKLPLGSPLSPLAGCFRYDTPTPLQLIRENDGLSTTLLFAETGNDLGPWVRGGFGTVRGLDVGDGAKRPLGRGGQFGGNYPGVVMFGRADGSAVPMLESMHPDVLRALFTIAGAEKDGIPGED